MLEALHCGAVFANQELFKVPADVRASSSSGDKATRGGVSKPGGGSVVLRCDGAQPFEEGVCTIPVDLNFLRQWEIRHVTSTRTNVFQGVQDLLIGGVFLKPKLVARETNDLEPFTIFGLQLVQREVLVGLAS